MARVSGRAAARKTASSAQMEPARTKRAPSPEAPGAPPPAPSPQSAPPVRIPLDVLGLSEARAWTVDDLEGMSISALLAVGFHVNEGDPALAMMERLSDDLLTLALALSNPNEDIPNDRILSILDGLSIRARVAAELHRRELAAAEST